MPEPSGSTGAQPSAEAKTAAYVELVRPRCRQAIADKRESDKALSAAYAIDAPAIHAAGQDGALFQVRDLIGYAERRYDGDSGPIAAGAREALEYLRTQLDLRFGAEGLA